MSTQYLIEKNVPRPSGHYHLPYETLLDLHHSLQALKAQHPIFETFHPSQCPFDQMEIGDSFLVISDDPSLPHNPSIALAAHSYGKRKYCRFATRTLQPTTYIRVWRTS